MQNFYDYKKFAILYVDDEEKSLNTFARAFEDHFRILTRATRRMASNCSSGTRRKSASHDRPADAG